MIAPQLRREAHAMLGFAERQKNLIRRYWAWELAFLVYTLVSVLSIGYLAAGLGETGRHVSASEVRQAQLYLLVGSVLWGYLSVVFVEIAYAIIWERWEGTIEYTFMAPVRRSTHLVGIAAFALLYGSLRTALVVAVGQFLFHLDFSHADLAAAGIVLVASTPALLGIGILASVLPLLSPEKGEQLALALEGVILLVSGVYYPITVLPWPLQMLGLASPLTYTLAATRDSLLAGRHIQDEAGTVVLLLVMGAILVPLGLVVFAWCEQRAKRLGLLKRSG